MAAQYDLIIIGTGPGGYVCAIRAAQLGMKVAVVEKCSTFGGICLNVGCIPSKSLLHASHCYDEAKHEFASMGISTNPTLDLAKMQAFKRECVKGNVDGIAYLLRKNKIDTVFGTGRIMKSGRVAVTSLGGETQTLKTKSIVIATGSDVIRLPGIEIDEKRVVSSTGALDFTAVPKQLIVVGAGVIGLELGSVWRRLGSDVLVIEYLPRILPGMDADVALSFQRILEKQGISFCLTSKVSAVETSDTGVVAKVEPVTGGGVAESIEADTVLIAVGRMAYIEGLGLAEVGVALDAKKHVLVDGHYQTNVAGVFAIGDVIAGPMLAHKAEDEGVAVAEIIAGQAGGVNYDVIPNVIYTSPEVASVGKTEEELKAASITYNIGKFPFTASGRAKAIHMTDGFVKILTNAATDRVLGVHIIGVAAGELIAEAAVLMEFSGSAEDLARTCHAHPTFSEAVKEAALSVAKRGVHF